MVPRYSRSLVEGLFIFLIKERMSKMKKITGNETRQMFLDFFKSKGHAIEPSMSLIPVDDPTLLWIGAGVAALKKYFDGTMKPENPRITNAQKSIRTNDIENVGVTARHHTFFEMLGNFSIGDYFKHEAIEFAWEFLTSSEWLGFEKEKLYITVHDKDDDAYNHWISLGVDPSHLLKTPNNFWEIGEGPCGPDSEIFYDRGEKYDPEHIGERLFFEELENDRYVEIWNLVFSQYNAKTNVPREQYQELPHKNIDTGMGLERLVSVIQEGETNFDTDFFLPIIEATQKKAKIGYAQDKMAYRVIADHIRTVTFALADGASFSNEGRGYVLRRILRRAVRYGKKIGIQDAFMFELVSVVSDIMKDYYTYLPEKVDFIARLVKIEEEKFHATLNDGEKMLGNMLAQVENNTLAGADAFRLYDTYGFPFELTLEIANEQGIDVDEEGFKEAMTRQKTMAKNARGKVESMGSQNAELMDFMTPSEFTYNPQPISGKVIAIFKDGHLVEQCEGEMDIMLDNTNFYAEMGGQCADTGCVSNDSFKAEVKHVVNAPNKQHLLHLVNVQGQLAVDDTLNQMVDCAKRAKIQCNHTATHILQKALKLTVGDHINQAGSYVDCERLRFDFTHYEKLTNEQLAEVERRVNEEIFKAEKVTIENMNIEEAKKRGAMALFSEKYGNEVRVVSVGDYSIELCGGCHVASSSDIGLFRIVSEESIGSGIRRIEAVTGLAAYEAFKHSEKLLETTASILKAGNVEMVVEKAEATLNENVVLKKENATLQDRINAYEAKDALKDVEMIGDVAFLAVESNETDNAALKNLAFSYRDSLDSGVVLLLSTSNDKLSYFVAVTKDLTAKGIKAGDLVKAVNAVCEGRGGGKPDFAQGGSKCIDKKNAVISEIKKALN